MLRIAMSSLVFYMAWRTSFSKALLSRAHLAQVSLASVSGSDAFCFAKLCVFFISSDIWLSCGLISLILENELLATAVGIAHQSWAKHNAIPQHQDTRLVMKDQPSLWRAVHVFDMFNANINGQSKRQPAFTCSSQFFNFRTILYLIIQYIKVYTFIYKFCIIIYIFLIRKLLHFV